MSQEAKTEVKKVKTWWIGTIPKVIAPNWIGYVAVENHKCTDRDIECVEMKDYKILESKLAKAREALKHISSDDDKMPDCCCDAGKLLSNHYDKVAREALKEIE